MTVRQVVKLVSAQVRDQVEAQVWDQAYDQVWGRVSEYVELDLEFYVLDEVADLLPREHVAQQMRESLEKGDRHGPRHR